MRLLSVSCLLSHNQSVTIHLDNCRWSVHCAQGLRLKKTGLQPAENCNIVSCPWALFAIRPYVVRSSTPPAASSVSRSFGLLRLGWIANADVATVCNLVGLLICGLLSFYLLRDFAFASSSSSGSSSGSDALRFANNDAYAL
jgi:hypothetical protein